MADIDERVAALERAVSRLITSAQPHRFQHELSGPDEVRPAIMNAGTLLNRHRSTNFKAGLKAVELTTGGTDQNDVSVDTTWDGTLNTLTLTGGQMVFPATQAASSGANTLDDYEEGTFTPSVGGNATYTSQVGNYVKIGKWVFIQGVIIINVLGTGSTTTVSGLPFTSRSGSQIGIANFSSSAINEIFMGCRITSSGTTLVLYGLAAAAASVTDSLAVFGDGASISFAAAYETTG